MKITISNTSKVVHVDGIRCRLWEGVTEGGDPVHCFVARLTTEAQGEALANFQRELVQTQPPSVDYARLPDLIPLTFGDDIGDEEDD